MNRARSPRTAGTGRRAPHRNASAEAIPSTFGTRVRLGRLLLVAALAVSSLQLVWVQLVSGRDLALQAESQRRVVEVEVARRGSILDRNGRPLAFTMDARSLTFQPRIVRKAIDDARAKTGAGPTSSARMREIADGISTVLGGDVRRDELLAKLEGDDDFVYLVRNVDPARAAALTSEFPEIGAEHQGVREYPGGQLAANLVGATGWDGHGLLGLEQSLDSVLAGANGGRTYDQGSDGSLIPGSERDRHPATNGADVMLTIDADLQYFVQQQTQLAKDRSGASAASTVVLDARTGEVLAMANDGTFNPSARLDEEISRKRDLGNPAVSSPFEPGSVNKLVTAAAAIEDGKTDPHEVLQVPGTISMAGVTVKDAWAHGLVPYTTTGIFGKSSNVGTLMLADRVGEDRYAEFLKLFGLGVRTDVGLPGESPGLVPEREQWSGGTFANLPIGQGLSMTLLQMTGLYQAIANDGLRIPPRIIRTVHEANGSVEEKARPEGVRVVRPDTARIVRDMFRAVVQSDTGNQQGTGPQAAVSGYQISGKTGTAQKVDPACRCYSNSKYWITFAGIAPADDPRFVIGIMLDEPQRGVHGQGGQSAAPLFHDIAGWLLAKENVPPSRDPGPPLVLQAG